MALGISAWREALLPHTSDYKWTSYTIEYRKIDRQHYFTLSGLVYSRSQSSREIQNPYVASVRKNYNHIFTPVTKTKLYEIGTRFQMEFDKNINNLLHLYGSRMEMRFEISTFFFASDIKSKTVWVE